jgi:electron transport complex protein RnfD
MIVTTLAVTTIAGMDPLVSLLSGGLVFGAVFMATDYATSPVTPVGRILFGFGCGLITALIRIFGGYPEGVMFSILIMNALVPFLNRIIPRKYGWVKPAKKTAAAPAKASASSGGAQ